MSTAINLKATSSKSSFMTKQPILRPFIPKCSLKFGEGKMGEILYSKSRDTVHFRVKIPSVGADDFDPAAAGFLSHVSYSISSCTTGKYPHRDNIGKASD
jgi:hypothetical protein